MGKRRDLFLINLPGAVHGSSIAGSFIERFVASDTDVIIPIQLSQRNQDLSVFKWSKLSSIVVQIRKILKHINKIDRFILFYTSSGLVFYRDLVFRLLLFRKNGVLIMHNKGLRSSSAPEFLKRVLFYNCEVFILADNLKWDIEKYVDASNIRVISNPYFGEEKFRIQNKNYSSLRFLFLSNLIRSKGVIESIRLVKELIRLGNDVTLEIVGSEIDVFREELLTTIGSDSDRIVFHGPKYGNDKAEILQRTNVMIFPSNYPMECFPLVIIEALANSTPVISLRNAAIPNIINETNGILFDSLDGRQRIIEAALTIHSLTPIEWQRLSKGSYRAYNEKYKLEDWIHIYKDLLGKNEIN